MADQFVVLTRYEIWKSGGVKDFCPWFVLNGTPRTEKEAKVFIEETKKRYADIDKKTKLKHEYQLQSYGDYLNETEIQKKTIDEACARNEAYYKSDAYKELLKKKRQAAKERKERQKKYLKEHGIEK